MLDELAEVFKEYEGEKGAIIPILQKVQEKLGYLSEEAVSEIAKFSRMTVNEIFGIASFYAQFRFIPSAKYTVKVCLGTACHVRGGQRIMETVKQELSISPGETTADYKFGLERVACFGCCALSPVVVVDGIVFSKMNPSKAKKVLASYR